MVTIPLNLFEAFSGCSHLHVPPTERFATSNLNDGGSKKVTAALYTGLLKSLLRFGRTNTWVFPRESNLIIQFVE